MKKALILIGVLLALAGLAWVLVGNSDLSNTDSGDKTSTTTVGGSGVKPSSVSVETFNSNILGLSWSIPVVSTLEEKIDTTRGDKKPFDTWSISGVSNVPYAIRATNPEIAVYSYEGAGHVLKYGGEKITGLCTSRKLFDEKNYEVKIRGCEEKVNRNGVHYLAFDIDFSYIGEYGSIQRFFGVKSVYAQSEYNRIVGTVLQTKSEKFPGLILYKLFYFGDNLNEVEVVKGEISSVIDTFKYID